MNSQCAAFDRREFPLLVSERGVTSCADGHLGRKYDRATEIDRIGDEVTAPGAKSRPCLQIGPEKKGQLTHRLQRIQLGRHFGRRAHRYGETAYFFFLDVVSESAPLRRVARYEVAVYARPHDLRCLLAKAERGKDGISPARRGRHPCPNIRRIGAGRLAPETSEQEAQGNSSRRVC